MSKLLRFSAGSLPRLVAGLVLVGMVLAGLAVAAVLTVAGGSDEGLDGKAQAVNRVFVDSLEGQPDGGKSGKDRQSALAAAKRVAAPLDGDVAIAKKGATAEGDRFSFPVPRGQGRSLTVSFESSTALGKPLAIGLALATLALLAGLLALIASRLTHAAVAAPLDHLRGALAKLQGGDYGARLAPRGAAEFRRLTKDFNAAAAAVGEAHAAIESRAATDSLTGVANHRRFHEALAVELERAGRERTNMAVVAVDLDGFRALNDAKGHPFGDEVLKEAAAALRETLRTTDRLARVGSDEFAVILPNTEPSMAMLVTDRAREAVAAAAGPEVALTCSAGYACFPEDARDSSTLLQSADGALRWAQDGGGNQTRRFDPVHVQLTASEEQRAEVVELLAQPDPIEPVYQPISNLSTGTVAGYEALSRFPHPPLRAPDAWFAQAHRCELGVELELRAIQAALEAVDRPVGTFLSLNLSPSALMSDAVETALPEDLSDIVIEITEHELAQDAGALLAKLEMIRGRGGKVAVDDAGAGYSGLQQVMRVQPDIIKLDRSLVEDMHHDPAKAALIDSFVRFANRTGAEVCAEGIETLEELWALADLDVTYGQGYVIARPDAPWTAMPTAVAGPLLRRSLRTGSDLSSNPELSENGDRRLEQVAAELSELRTVVQLDNVLARVAQELNAEQVALLRYDGLNNSLAAITEHTWLARGDRLSLSGYPTAANVLKTRELVQVLSSDGGADIGELALLGTTGFQAMLVVPIVGRGVPLGVMLAFSPTERPWSRSETHRARMISYGLGTAVEGLALDEAPSDPGPAPVVAA